MSTPQKEYTHCLRCGRKLKNKEARILGYGTVCLKKVQAETNKKIPLFKFKR